MKLGVTTIQRDRGPWLVEWFAFHYLVGFRHFYFYAHMCTDNTLDILSVLARKLNIKAVLIEQQMDRVQLGAYQHACDTYMDEIDWMAFIDGDEFLFPTNCDSLTESLREYADKPISALGVFNVTFGSSGHIAEPEGLITDNYRRCSSSVDFMSNRRIKSIVKGGQKISTTNCSHIFNTTLGTFDESLRPLNWGYVPQYEPTYKWFRINHYVCQSYDYFKSFKSTSGHADASASTIRDEEWWSRFDRNEEFDSSLTRFSERLRLTIDWLTDRAGSTWPLGNS